MNDSIEMRWEQANEAGRRHFSAGDLARAEEQFRIAIQEAERIGGDSVQLASSLGNLGQLKYTQRDFQAAETLFSRSLSIRERALGPEHNSVVHSVNNLAAMYVASGDLEKAEPLFLRAMGITEKRLKATQGDLAVNLNNLARLYFKRNDYASAEPLLERLLTIKLPLGRNNPEVANVLTSLAKLRHALGRYDEAERLWRRVLSIREESHSFDDPAVATILESYADTCAMQSRLDKAVSLRQRALSIREKTLGADHPSLQGAMARIEQLNQMLAAAQQEGTAEAAEAEQAPEPEYAASQDSAAASSDDMPPIELAAAAPPVSTTPVDIMPVPSIVQEMVADAERRSGPMQIPMEAEAAVPSAPPRWPAEFEMPGADDDLAGLPGTPVEPIAPRRSLAMAQLPALEVRGDTPGGQTAVTPAIQARPGATSSGIAAASRPGGLFAPVTPSPPGVPPSPQFEQQHRTQWIDGAAAKRAAPPIEIGVIAPTPTPPPAAQPPSPRRTVAESRPLRKPNLDRVTRRRSNTGRWVIFLIVLLAVAAGAWVLLRGRTGGLLGGGATADSSAVPPDAARQVQTAPVTPAPPVTAAPAPAPVPAGATSTRAAGPVTTPAGGPARASRDAGRPAADTAAQRVDNALKPPTAVPSVDLGKVDSLVAQKGRKVDSSTRIIKPPLQP